MWGLSKLILINFVQLRPYRPGGRLLLLGAVLVILSLILSAVGTGGIPRHMPVLFAQAEDPPPPLGGLPVAGPFKGLLVSDENAQLGFYSAEVNVLDSDAEVHLFNPYPPIEAAGFMAFRSGIWGIPSTRCSLVVMGTGSTTWPWVERCRLWTKAHPMQ
jgi:hypothetical protein